MIEPLDTIGIDIDQLSNTMSDGDLFDLIHDSTDSAFLEFNPDELPDKDEAGAFNKAMAILNSRTPTLDQKEKDRLLTIVQENPNWQNLKGYLNLLATFGEVSDLGTYENIEKIGITKALPKSIEEKIEEQQIMAKAFLNGAERFKRNALVNGRYLKYDTAQDSTHSAVDYMNMAVVSLRTVKHLRNQQMQIT
jgi:hypothetical protein